MSYIHDHIRGMLKYDYIKFKKKIMRKHWVCEDCGSKGDTNKFDKLEVHHIIPLNDRPDLLMEETNVKVICNECHIKIHKSTKKEYLQYLKKKLKKKEEQCQTEKI